MNYIELTLLYRRIPKSAADIRFGLSDGECRVYFTMPKDWMPEMGSGIFSVVSLLTSKEGRRWQIRL